jgi:hypothetical protein
VTRARLVEVTWMEEAACVDAPRLPWVAEPDETSLVDDAAMRTVCAGCPVLAECEEYVRAARIGAGFWAGHHRGVPRQPVQLDLLASTESLAG